MSSFHHARAAFAALLVAALAARALADNAPASILDLQPQASITHAAITDGVRQGQAGLIALNPRIGAWFVLQIDWGGGDVVRYHLENPAPRQQALILAPDFPQGLVLRSGDASQRCTLWGAGAGDALRAARHGGLAYAPLCEGRLYLRNAVRGTYTQIEKTTNFLRDHVWGGDRIVGFVREQLFRDAYLEHAETHSAPDEVREQAPAAGAPPAPALDAAYAGRAVVPAQLQIDVAAATPQLLVGRWYAVREAPGIFVSAIEPRALAADVADPRRTLHPPDAVESSALAYLVAFDLQDFDLGFALGTDHPRVGWSERVQPQMRDGRPGPDGIGQITPLAATGMVPPWLAARTAATFTGGFKRQHGAFRWGELALRNAGSHYGFIEQGTRFSTLQPGLATLYVRDDGFVGMKTWSAQDDALLPRLRHARQNGVALVERDAAGRPVPGALVTRWGEGNWSGSADEKLRTLRAGACLVETPQQRFLVYGYFSAATPSTMARTFLAYGCTYAMHLDMNALEHTYLALYTHRPDELLVQHLVEGMREVDKKGGGDVLAPRFLGFPDDRDFFYLVRREAS